MCVCVCVCVCAWFGYWGGAFVLLFVYFRVMSRSGFCVLIVDICPPSSVCLSVCLSVLKQSNWREVVPQRDDVMRFCAPINNNMLALCYMHDVKVYKFALFLYALFLFVVFINLWMLRSYCFVFVAFLFV